MTDLVSQLNRFTMVDLFLSLVSLKLSSLQNSIGSLNLISGTHCLLRMNSSLTVLTFKLSVLTNFQALSTPHCFISHDILNLFFPSFETPVNQ